MSTLPSNAASVSDNTEIPSLLQSVRGGVSYGVLNGYGILELVGPDAGRFLQNQTTQDINAIALGQAKEAAAVDRTGKLQGVFTVYRSDVHSYWLLLEMSQITGLMSHWHKFKLFDQFDMYDRTDEFIPYLLIGPKALTLLQALSAGNSAKAFSHQSLIGIPTRVLRFNRFGLPAVIALLPSVLHKSFPKETQARGQALGAIPFTEDIQEALRIENGIPKFGVDMTHDTLFPETGLQEEAVNYEKGCYIGQEVIARVKTYGRTPNALVGLRFPIDADLPAIDSVCSKDGQSIGTIKSVLKHSSLGQPIALAYLGREYRTPGETLAFNVEDKRFEALVTALPFIKPVQETSSLEESLHRALKAFADGDDETAIALLSEITTDLPEPGTEIDMALLQAVEALGVILGRQNHTEEAIEWMETLLKYDPDSIMAHTNLSIFYLKLGNKDMAEEEKAKATVAGMRQKAREAGFDLAKLDAERQKQEAAKKKQMEERIQLFIQALEYSPDDPLGNFGLGSAYLELKQYAPAIEPLQKTLAVQPTHSVAYLMLGKAFEGLKQPESAIAIYQKGVGVAASRGDRMPMEEMQQRLNLLQG